MDAIRNQVWHAYYEEVRPAECFLPYVFHQVTLLQSWTFSLLALRLSPTTLPRMLFIAHLKTHRAPGQPCLITSTMPLPFGTSEPLHSAIFYCHLQDPGRIEVPVYLQDDILRTNPASLGDPVPCKPPLGTSTLPHTPSGVADDAAAMASVLGGSTYTTSQPNSATSSLASLIFDGELVVSSRQSSGSDLCARPTLANLPHHNFPRGDNGLCLSARSDASNHDDSVELIVQFDCSKLQTLGKIKTRSPPGIRSTVKIPTPSAPTGAARSLSFAVSKDGTGNEGAVAQDMAVRPLRARPMSQPGTYNPYDLAGLLANYRNGNKNYSPDVKAHASQLRPRSSSRINFNGTTACSNPDSADVDCIVMIPGAGRCPS